MVEQKVVFVNSLDDFPTPVGNLVTFGEDEKYILQAPINSKQLQFTTQPGGKVEIITENEAAYPWQTELTGNLGLFTGDIGRLQMNDIDFICTTQDAQLTTITAVTEPRSIFVLIRSLVYNFGKICTNNGVGFFSQNVTYFDCADGVEVNTTGFLQGSGINWRDIAFVRQLGDHVTFIGTASFLIFQNMSAVPLPGDRVFNLDNTVSSFAVFDNSLALIEVLGGKTGLIKTFTTTGAMNAIFPTVETDSSGGAFTLELPNLNEIGINNGVQRIIYDTGNAGTNPVTLVPSTANIGVTINGRDRFVLDTDSQKLTVELANDEWLITASSDSYLVTLFEYFTNGTTPTVLGDTSTFVTIAGTYLDSNLTRFLVLNGVATYTGWRDVKLNISCSVQLLLTPQTKNDIIDIALFKNGIEVVGSRATHQITGTLNTTASQVFNVSAFVDLLQNDTIDVRLRNTSNSDDIIVTNFKLICDRGS